MHGRKRSSVNLGRPLQDITMNPIKTFKISKSPSGRLRVLGVDLCQGYLVWTVVKMIIPYRKHKQKQGVVIVDG